MKENILWTACVTPFVGDNQKIDYPSLEKLLKTQENNNNGVVLLGSTGEGLSLSQEERLEIVNRACSLKIKTPIIVGVPSYHLPTALGWLNICNDLPISGYLLTTPLYSKPGIRGQIQWFERLLESSKKPAMLYNIPSRTGVKLYPQTLEALSDHPLLFGLKDSSGIVGSVTNYKKAAPSLKIFCGDDDMMPAMAMEGAEGLVSVASNVWPLATNQYVKKCLKGEKVNLIIWRDALKVLFSASNPIPVKALSHAMGLIESCVVRPPLSEKDLPSLEELKRVHFSICEWEKSL